MTNYKIAKMIFEIIKEVDYDIYKELKYDEFHDGKLESLISIVKKYID